MSTVIRRGAHEELRELLALERWLLSLSGRTSLGASRSRSCRSEATEINDRCRVLRLVRRGIDACNGDRRKGGLRGFLSQLGADEASRAHAVFERGGVLQSAGIDRA